MIVPAHAHARTAALPGLVATLVLAASSVASADPTPPGGLTNDLFEPAECVMCHSISNAKVHADDPLYSPFLGWQGSMMANAARDPVFWAGVALADQDHPGETEVCIRCHSPRAFLNGRADATEITDLDPADMDGVTCEACHRMMDDSPNPLGNASYRIDDVLVDGVVPRRGPWDDYEEPVTPPHAWIADPFTGSSELCGTCHDVSTDRPRLDDKGNEIAPQFNEQRTYSEWAGSSFAAPGDGFASCQDCHMPAVADMAACQAFINNNTHPTGGRRHDLVGANRFMLQLLQQEYGSQGSGDVADLAFETSIARLDELLASAATVEVVGPDSVDTTVGLSDLEVTVTNHSGHKLPTGYSEGRVMWLEVTATYNGGVVWSSGAFEPGVGPTEGPQLRTYEGVGDQLATGTTFHLLLNDHWVEDTRIPPLGLAPDLQTDPVGGRYTLLDDGTWPNYDIVPYTFAGVADLVDDTPEADDDDELVVTVNLWYLINSPAYIELLANDNESNEAGSDVAMLFDAAGGAPPMLLGEAELTIPITAFGGASGSSSSDSGPAVDSTADSPGASTDGPGATTGAGTSSGTGGGGQDDDGGGCSCTSGGQQSGGAGWLALFGLAAVRRRRRAASWA